MGVDKHGAKVGLGCGCKLSGLRTLGNNVGLRVLEGNTAIAPAAIRPLVALVVDAAIRPLGPPFVGAAIRPLGAPFVGAAIMSTGWSESVLLLCVPTRQITSTWLNSRLMAISRSRVAKWRGLKWTNLIGWVHSEGPGCPLGLNVTAPGAADAALHVLVLLSPCSCAPK